MNIWLWLGFSSKTETSVPNSSGSEPCLEAKEENFPGRVFPEFRKPTFQACWQFCRPEENLLYFLSWFWNQTFPIWHAQLELCNLSSLAAYTCSSISLQQSWVAAGNGNDQPVQIVRKMCLTLSWPRPKMPPSRLEEDNCDHLGSLQPFPGQTLDGLSRHRLKAGKVGERGSRQRQWFVRCFQLEGRSLSSLSSCFSSTVKIVYLLNHLVGK